MEPSHESHHPRPKIAKNATSKLPQAFRMQGAVSKRASEQITQQPKYHPPQPKSSAKQKRQDNKRQKKSQNPFLPLKQFIKKAEELSREMREANNDLNNSDRFTKYTLEGDKNKNKYKYENCITLSIIKKNTNGCLKKVLHVPTLTVHYLKQSLISSNFDKNELMEWIQIVNRQEGACMKILQLFWNMPEDYYSLLYEYSEGLLLDSLNESLHTLPLYILRDIAILHLGINVGIFNSHIILHEQNGIKIIRYLPLYQQSEFSVSELTRLKEIVQSELGNEDGARIGRRMNWRLGLLLLNGYIGTPILSQEILKIQLPLTKCCLFHEIVNSSNSLAAMYIQIGGGLDQSIEDFLCNCLRSRKHGNNYTELKSLRRHKWFLKSYDDTITLGELIAVVDPTLGTHSKFQLNKVAKILESIGLILQNVSGVEFIINSESIGVKHLARQLGMTNEIGKIVNDLKRIYRN